MNNQTMTSQEHDVFRWGGLAGMMGSVVLVIVFVIVGVFVGEASTSPERALVSFPDIFVARVFENGLFLLVLILWSVHFIGLFYALRQTHLAPALFGSVLGVLGLMVMAVGALPHVTTVPVSEFYTQPDVTAAELDMLTAMWATISAVFDAILIAGLVIAPFAFLGLGVAMLSAPNFGSALGWGSLVLAVLSGIAAVVSLAIPHSPLAAVSVLGMIVFHFAVGWRVFKLANTAGATG